jgi:predicted nucleotidyltransferase
MIISKDFKEFIELLNKHNVRYLIVGAYAVAFHGYPRYTKDIDLWISINRTNADNLMKALVDFGFGSVGLKAEDFLEPGFVIQLGYPPNRIDLLTELKGMEFEACFISRVEVTVDGTVINFIDLENLKINKKVAGRHQDLADLENLM